jgi:predicted deacylase
MKGRLSPGRMVESFVVEAVGTHNSIPPFTQAISPGLAVTIHAIRITGEKEGPSVYVGGGQHGDEIGGIASAWEVAKAVDHKKLKGTLVVVPLQNPAAFRFRTRLNPFDPIDPDWIYPGHPSGTHYQRTKFILNNLASECDCVIDLHTAGISGANSGYLYVPPETGSGSGARSLKLGLAFGGDRILQGKSEDTYGWRVSSAMPFVAAREGRLGLYPEAGQGGGTMPEKKFVDYLVTGTLNVLKTMQMLEGEIVTQGERVIVDPSSEKSVKAPVEGLLKTLVSPGQNVRKGQVIAEIRRIPIGLVKVKAPIAGNVIFLHRLGSVGEGESLATLSPGK